MCIPLIQHNREVKLIQGFDGNKTLGNEENRPRLISEENLKINLREAGYSDVNSIHQIQ